MFQKIVTGLFMACSKTSDSEYAIRKCNSIRMLMRRNGIEMNEFNYASAISAYGKAGAIYEAFNLVDEIIENESKTSTIRKKLLTPVYFL